MQNRWQNGFITFPEEFHAFGQISILSNLKQSQKFATIVKNSVEIPFILLEKEKDLVSIGFNIVIVFFFFNIDSTMKRIENYIFVMSRKRFFFRRSVFVIFFRPFCHYVELPLSIVYKCGDWRQNNSQAILDMLIKVAIVIANEMECDLHSCFSLFYRLNYGL